MVAANALYNVAALRAEGDTVKEDVSQVITRISPEDTPIYSAFGKTKAKADLHEWLYDRLRTPVSDNAHLDGADFGNSVAGDTTTAPRRVGNYCQISKVELYQSDRTNDALDLHGRKMAMAYQMSKKAPELKLDVETSITANQIAVAMGAATAARSAGLPVWIATNDDFGATGASGSLSNGTYGVPTGARTDGTNRALSEATLLGVIRDAWIAGGKIDRIFVAPEIKQRMSAYLFQGGTAAARIAQPTQDFGPNPGQGVTVIGAVDVWKSDFGTHLITPCRQQRVDDVFCLDTRRFKVAYLRKYRVKKMGVGGDHERKHLLVDWTLESNDEAASGMVTDINDVAMTN